VRHEGAKGRRDEGRKGEEEKRRRGEKEKRRRGWGMACPKISPAGGGWGVEKGGGWV